MSASLLLVGCGKMGGALLKGWLEQGVQPGTITVIEPNQKTANDLARTFAVTVLDGADSLASDNLPDVVVIAIKPQALDEVLPAYRSLVRPGTVFLSIAAGKPLAGLAQLLGEDAALVRTMPNTPAAIGEGITVACAGAHVTDQQIALCQSLLEAVGDVAWIDDEALMDAVTAVSGSGPAYVFLLAEAMEKAGIAAGLPATLAERLARATVAGAGGLLKTSNETAETLRRNVTSPGGTTAAALEVLTADDGMGTIMERAVLAAAKRSRELAE